MPTLFSQDIYRDGLSRIVQSVFRAMMDFDAAVSHTSWVQASDTLTSAVHFVGEWQGAVLVECHAPQACQFAARFMGIALPAVVDDDVRDVMGELANMVAGNLKCLLPRGTGLSLPTVVEGTDYTLRVCGVHAVERIVFSSATGIFRITLIEVL